MISDAAYSLNSSAEGDTAFGQEPVAQEPRARAIPRVNIQAFCEDQETAAVIQKASEDRRLAKAHVTVQMGGMEAAAAFYRNASTPNLIVIESLLDRTELLADLDRLAEVCDPGTKVIAIGHVNDVLLYRELLRRGVSEYVVAPLSVTQVIESISSVYTDPETGPIGQVIAFVGAKGGAGSSTVCHNTAFAIANTLRSDVVIADLDLPFGTAGLDFNQDPLQGIADALAAPERLDEVLLDRLLSRCSDHLSLFAAPTALDRPYDVDMAACETVLDIVRDNVPWVAVDVPHLWTGWAKEVVLKSDFVVITAMPDLASLRNTKNLVDQLKASRPMTPPSASAQSGRLAEAAGDRGEGLRPGHRARTQGRHRLRRSSLRHGGQQRSDDRGGIRQVEGRRRVPDPGRSPDGPVRAKERAELPVGAASQQAKANQSARIK